MNVPTDQPAPRFVICGVSIATRILSLFLAEALTGLTPNFYDGQMQLQPLFGRN
jgi:hypothetical protein